MERKFIVFDKYFCDLDETIEIIEQLDIIKGDKKKMKNRFENVYAIDKNNNKLLTKEEYKKEYDRIEKKYLNSDREYIPDVEKKLELYKEWSKNVDNLISLHEIDLTWVYDEDYEHEINKDGKIWSSEIRYKSNYNVFLWWIGQLIEFDQGRKVVYSDRNFTLSEMEGIHLNYYAIGEKLPYHSLNEIASIICDEIEKNKEKENE